MSEQSKIDAERDEFEGFVRSDAWMFQSDLSKNPATGDYWDVNEQCGWDAWKARASQPVGVPDGETWQTVALLAHELADMVIKGDAPEHCARTARMLMSEFYRSSAAPTVKAEQVRYSAEDLQKEALNAGLQYVRDSDDHYVTGTTEQALGFIRNMIGVDVRLTGTAPSLPAAGSAVEEVEVVATMLTPRRQGWQDLLVRGKHDPRMAGDNYDVEPLMTVAQHNRIVAALSDQQSAPDWIDPVALSSCGPVYDAGWRDGVAEAKRLNHRVVPTSAPERVSVPVPVELARKLVRTYEDAVIDAAHWTDMDCEVTQLRTLLASHGRAEA